jgi:hypothetical protein
LDRQSEEKNQAEIDKFAADPKNEFFADVRDLMGDIWEVQRKRGVAPTLKGVYDDACRMHPEVSKALAGREQNAKARELTANAQRAKAAAVSVKGSAPMGNPAGTEPQSIRQAIVAAMEASDRS